MVSESPDSGLKGRKAVFMKRSFFIMLISLLIIPALPHLPVAAQDSTDTYWPTNGWRTSTPEEQGMDSDRLIKLLESIQTNESLFDTLMIIRHGYVVFDTSQYPYSSDQKHAMFSVTKSFISTLVGIALDKGYITSTDQSIWDFFSKDTTTNMNERKAALTLKNLLTHTTGLAMLKDDLNMYTLTSDDPSWVQFILDHEMMSSPGDRFQYYDANAHLASAIIGLATGQSAEDFARDTLFEPLGITDFIWMADPQGVTWGGNGLFLSPRDLAKLGYLYLRDGEWDGQQLLSSTYIDTATSVIIPGQSFGGYGFLWWTGSMGRNAYAVYAAVGLGGQYLWVVPDLDLIVVWTGNLNYLADSFLPLAISAATSDTALPPNPDALARLNAMADSMTGNVSVVVPDMPDIAHQVSSKTYAFADNRLGWQSMTIDFQNSEAFLALTITNSRVEVSVGLDGVRRLSSGSMPADPIRRPFANIHLTAKGGWTDDHTFEFSMQDLMGTQSWQLAIDFHDPVTVDGVEQVGLGNFRLNTVPD